MIHQLLTKPISLKLIRQSSGYSIQGWYVLGREVDAFEQEFASFHGKNLHAVGVANGTDAISLCLRGIGLGTGDEVITPSHTAVATVAGIEQAGCTPVFADIDPKQDALPPSQLAKE